jgi:predicted nucleic acid-binding protein
MAQSFEDHTPSFVDTNVLVYAAVDDDARSKVAQSLLRSLMVNDELCTSTQVLQETFVVLTRKIHKTLSSDKALKFIDGIASWRVVVLDYPAFREAVGLLSRVKISFWDSLIITAAAKSGASRIYTEDLSHGRTIEGVTVFNPFFESAQPDP